MSKTDWNNLPTKIWRVVLFKENEKGEQKFYEYDGDHSWIAEALEDIEPEYLYDIKEENK
jgi:hypothetical protein